MHPFLSLGLRWRRKKPRLSHVSPHSNLHEHPSDISHMLASNSPIPNPSFVSACINTTHMLPFHSIHVLHQNTHNPSGKLSNAVAFITIPCLPIPIPIPVPGVFSSQSDVRGDVMAQPAFPVPASRIPMNNFVSVSVSVSVKFPVQKYPIIEVSKKIIIIMIQREEIREEKERKKQQNEILIKKGGGVNDKNEE